jgi:hypothetical protein
VVVAVAHLRAIRFLHAASLGWSLN